MNKDAEYNKKMLEEKDGQAVKIERCVMRLDDGKILPVIDRCGDEIRVIEYFKYADEGPPSRPLKLWHKADLYINIGA